MSVTWLTLKNQLHAYLSQVAPEGKLKEKMTSLQDLMEAGIRDVQNASDLYKWMRQMFSRSLDISVTLDTTSNIDPYFIFRHQTLSVADTLQQIADKIESMIDVHDRVNIEVLKRNFVFDQPELVSHASEPGTELDVTDADTAHTTHAPHSPPPPLPDVSPATGKRDIHGERKHAQMLQLLAGLRHLAAPDKAEGARALQPLPPDLRAKVGELELALASALSRAGTAEARARRLEADNALYQAEYRRKAAELAALQQKYAKWEAAKRERAGNVWAHMQDGDPFEGV
jgi:hypothetical protein